MIWWVAIAWAGWLGDGSGAYVSGPETTWSWPTDVAWQAPTEAWSNASPVPFGDLMCVTEEPTGVACVEAASGAWSWRAHSDFADTLSSEAREEWSEKLTVAGVASVELDTLRKTYSLAQREARRGGEEAMASLPLLARRMDAAREQVTIVEGFATPADKGVIGYGTPTPTVRGDGLYALFGQGVASRFDTKGRRIWSVWLGPPATPMRGYHHGHAASMRWAGDTLVVPLGTLRGLDPDTGAERWRAGTYDHYGTPGIGQVDETAVIVTPGGEVVRGDNGQVVARGVCELLYVGPYVEGPDVWCVGNREHAHAAGPKRLEATALHLQSGVGGVTVVPRWQTSLGEGTMYASPVRWRDNLLVLSADRVLTVLRMEDGAVMLTRDLTPEFGARTAYPSPWVVGEQVYIATEQGTILHWPTGDLEGAPRVLQTAELRSTPVAQGQALYLRTLTGLVRVGR